MITIIYISLTVIYTICYILDGPDIKPVFNRKLGIYLHRKAEKFYHIHYCNPNDCIFVYRAIRNSIRNAKQEAMASITITNYDIELIKHTVKLDKEQLYKLRNNLSSIKLIDEAKYICSCAILKEVERRIKFDINEDNPDYCIYVTGSIVVEKNDRRHKRV